MSNILTLNTGSSSLKFGLYRANTGTRETEDNPTEPLMVLHGQVDGIKTKPRLIIHRGAEVTEASLENTDPDDTLSYVFKALSKDLNGAEISAVGHRIVHGGTDIDAPMLLTPDLMSKLEKYTPLAPLHQPGNLAGVEMARKIFPNALQIGCFDTAFHRNHPWVNDTFALPHEYYDSGIRRFGFHGLSYEYITGEIERLHPDLHHKRIVVAHLGNGASMCAIRQGQSVGSTMGFTALDGLPMGTRCGQIDPGVVLYLIEQKNMKPHDVVNLLYNQSGLLGLSGLSSDMRILESSSEPRAAQAIDYYVSKIRREIGAMSAILGGIDAMVFCGGIGENSATIRERVINGLDYLGLSIDPVANAVNATEIGLGPTRLMVIPTDEERIIARAAANALSNGRDLQKS